MASTSTISLRLPKEARERLDRVAAQSRRSRSYIIQRALEIHLDDVARAEAQVETSGRYARLLEFAGAIAKVNGGRSKEEIDRDVEWLRGDD
jgi:predicted transcriptional regulator